MHSACFNSESPITYDPYKYPDKNKERRNTVLSSMLALNMITDEEYNESKNEEISKKLKEIEASAQDQIEEKIIDALEEIDTIVNEIKNSDNLKMNQWIDAKKKIKEFHKEQEIIEKVNHDTLKVDDNVLVLSINKIGKITRINNGKYTVNVNGLSLILEKNKLEYVEVAATILTA